MTANDGGVARMWAVRGLAMVLRSPCAAAESVTYGALVRVLRDWLFDSAPFLLLVPTRKNRSRKVQMLSNFLISSFRSPIPETI